MNNARSAGLYMVEDITMTCMIFTVSEGPSGWFVQAYDKLGPFFCKQRAVDLAEGMVSALRSMGEEAEMRVTAHPDPAPLTRERPNFADKWRTPAPSAALSDKSFLRRLDATEAEQAGSERDRAEAAWRPAAG